MQTWHSSGAHSDPVWQLQWVDRGAEAEEVLVSVSTDGRVCQWSTSQASSVLVVNLNIYIMGVVVMTCFSVPRDLGSRYVQQHGYKGFLSCVGNLKIRSRHQIVLACTATAASICVCLQQKREGSSHG